MSTTAAAGTAQSKIPFIQQPQHNGGAALLNGGTQAQLRPQFRHQGSSFGGAGHVTPMAVMVAPSKVDYSVTKGGLRLWAVLLVFIVLCSSLYTLFSSKELSELALEIDGDENFDFDGDIDDDADEVATHNRRAEKDTTPSREYISQSKTFEESRKAHQPIQDVPPDSTDDDRLDEDEEMEQEEEARLADLRAKAERKERISFGIDETTKVEHEDGDVNGEDDDDSDAVADITSEIEVTEQTETLRKIGKRIRKPAEDEAEQKQEEPKRSKARRRRIEIAEELDQEEADKADLGEDREEEEDKQQQKQGEGTTEEENKDEQRAQDEIEKEIIDEDHGEEEEELVQRRRKSRRRPRVASPSAAEKPTQECKRKHCPPEYNRHPRKSLLKQIPSSMPNRYKERRTVNFAASEEEEEDDAADEEGDNGDEPSGDEELDDENINDLAAVKKGKLNDRSTYKRHAITNRDDHRFRDQLDRADYLIEKHDFHSAIAIFESILRNNPDSPRAHFGIARANDIRSEIESDHSFLDMAINEYQEVLDIDDTPDALFNQAAYRLIDRARFRGALHRVLQAQRSLIDRYPDDLQLHNDQGLTFLMMGRDDDARRIFENVLKISPANGVAQAYYGYIAKLHGDLENGVLYMRKGLRAAREVIADPRFYYHFGDALMRLGRRQEAYRIYSIGTKVGLFLSPYQRSLYNVEGLKSQPWWTVEQTSCSKHLKGIERQWTVIREEAVTVLNTQLHLFVPEHEELIIDGQWSAYYLFASNSWNSSNCLRAPRTCNIMRMFKDSSQCLKSEIKFSLLTSGTRVWPHCGYSNCRLQAHLGLIVPSEARLRVADEVRGWKAGRFIIFDDSFEHELWFEGASANKYRLILKLDLWHPEVDPARRVEFRSV